MGIRIGNPPSVPPLQYDHVFMQSLRINQNFQQDNNAPPYFTLAVEYRLYAVDPEGRRHYQSQTNTVTVEDYARVALERAAQGDLDLAQAMGAIEVALARILEDVTDLQDTTVFS
jgi:hypothetical protein